MKLDPLDRRILHVLQRDGRIANNELAAKVGRSPSPCLRRVRMLEEAGVISRYVAVVDPLKAGVAMTFFVRIGLEARDEETVRKFTHAMSALDPVAECYLMLGDCDALLRVVTADMDDYRRFQSAHLTRANGIQSVRTDVPSQTVKQTLVLPL
jgi:DNA-binding Lrp family transcriptional regulator